MEYKIGTKVFGQWEITEEIGQGTYGKVYIVEKNEYGVQTKSALKVLTIPSSVSEVRSALSNGMDEKSVTSYFKSRVENIMRECAAMSTLKNCENIVHFEDYTVIDHNPDTDEMPVNNPESIGWDILIRMELLTDLDSFQRNHPMTERDVIKMAKDILNALIYCKKKGIVHRDIKPANILVSETGVFKLGDFGESRTMDKTIGATKRGTETYMAPEVYQNQPYGSNVDIYSLGLVMYKLMNKNRLPFYPPAGQMIKFTDTEIALKRRMEGEMPSVPVDASEGLTEIILRAISYSKDSRYREASDMLEDITKLETGLADDFSNANPFYDYENQSSDADADNFEYQDKTVGVFDNIPDVVNDRPTDVDKTAGVFDNFQENNTYRSETDSSTVTNPTRSHTKKYLMITICSVMIFVLLCASIITWVNIKREKNSSDKEYSVSMDDSSEEIQESIEESALLSEETELMDQWSNVLTTFSSYIGNNSVGYYTQDTEQTIELLGMVLRYGAETKGVTYSDAVVTFSYTVELSNMEGEFVVILQKNNSDGYRLMWSVGTDEIYDNVSVIDDVFTDKIHFGMKPEEVFEKLGITEEMAQSVNLNGTEFKTSDKRVFVLGDEFYSDKSNLSLWIEDSEIGNLQLLFFGRKLQQVYFEQY